MQSFRTITFFFLFLLITAASSCRTKPGHNKYREAKVRPSERQLKADKKHNKRMEKAYKKQMQTNRKKLFGRKKAPGT
jgi:hypothetical protein